MSEGWFGLPKGQKGMIRYISLIWTKNIDKSGHVAIGE